MQPYAPRSGAVLSAVRLHGGKIFLPFDDALLDGGNDVLHRDDGIHLDAILVEGFPDGGLFARALLLAVDGDDHRLDVHLRFFFELGQDDDALDNLWAYTDQMNAIYPPTSDEFINHALDVLDFISGRELDAEAVADDFDVHVLSPIEAGLDEDSRMLASEVFDEVPEQFKKEMQLMHSYNELTREELVLNMHYVLRLPLDEGTVDDILAGFNEAKSFFDEYREDGGLPALGDKTQEVLDSKLNDLADAIDKLADAYYKCPATLTDDEVGVVLDALEPVMDKFEDFNELRAEAISILTNILRSYMNACDEDGWDEGDDEEAWDEDEDDDDFIQADEDDDSWDDDGK